MSSSPQVPPVYPRRSVIGPNLRLVTSNNESSSLSSSSPFHPDSFVPQFDVVYELIHNRDSYMGDEQVSIYSMPPVCKVALDRIRSKVSKQSGSSKPGIGVAISCAAYNGYLHLKQHEDIATLCSLKSAFDEIDVSEDYLQELGSYFRNYRISVPNPYADSGDKRENIRVPAYIRDMFSSLSDSMGFRCMSSLISVGVMHTLSLQSPVVTRDQRKRMEKIVNRYLLKLKLRRRFTEVLIQTVQEEGSLTDSNRDNEDNSDEDMD